MRLQILEALPSRLRRTEADTLSARETQHPVIAPTLPLTGLHAFQTLRPRGASGLYEEGANKHERRRCQFLWYDLDLCNL